MLELIQIVLFGGNILVTPEPILVDTEPRLIAIQKPLKAINCSASFNVDISEHITTSKYPDPIREAEAKFPQGCLLYLLMIHFIIFSCDASFPNNSPVITPSVMT